MSRRTLRAAMALGIVSFFAQTHLWAQVYFPQPQGNPPPTRHTGSLPFQNPQFSGRPNVGRPRTVLANQPYGQQYTSQQYAPQQYAPQQYAPQQYAPQQYAPQQYAPRQYVSQQYVSQQYAPQAQPANSPRYPGFATPQTGSMPNSAGHQTPAPSASCNRRESGPYGWTMNPGRVAPSFTQGGFCDSGFCGVNNGQPSASSSTDYGYGYGCGAEKTSQGFWYGGGRTLYMTRDRGDNVWLSLDSDNLPTHLLDSHDASMDWQRGLEIYGGRAFDCGRSATEGRYWGVYSDVQAASVLQTAAVGNFDTPIDFTPLVFDNGAGGGPEPVANYFLNAEIHRVQRSYEAHNLEINFLGLLGGCEPCVAACGSSCGGGSCGCGECGSSDWGAPVASPLQVRWVAGLRYFRFDEGFQFATDRGSIVLGDASLEELYYEIDVANHLIGLQLGGRFDYASCSRWSLHGDTKIGLYGNHITHHQFLGCGSCAATIDDVGGPFHGESYDISSSKNDASMVAEFDFGCDVAISRCWSAGFGYRLVGITGVALTTAQIPRYFEDLGEARRIDSTGSMLLHGGYAQIEWVR